MATGPPRSDVFDRKLGCWRGTHALIQKEHFPEIFGAVAFKRNGEPNLGEFSDAVIIKKFGLPDDLSAL